MGLVASGRPGITNRSQPGLGVIENMATGGAGGVWWVPISVWFRKGLLSYRKGREPGHTAEQGGGEAKPPGRTERVALGMLFDFPHM